MRILFFISYPARMAGANRSLRQLVLTLPPHIHPVVIATDEGRAPATYREDGVPVFIEPPGPALREYGKQALHWSPARKLTVALGQMVPYWRRMRERLRQGRFDLVHANDLRGALMVGPPARSLGLPLVVHERGERAVGGAIAGFVDRLSSAHVAVCRNNREELPQRARAKTVVVYNGTDDIAGKGNDLLSRKGPVKIVSMASMVPFKGHHHLLRALAILRDRVGPDAFECRIAGEFVEGHEPYHQMLHAMRADLELNQVSFLGWQDDPFALYRDGDMSVMCSVSRETLAIGGRTLDVRGNEGLPRTHLEAMCFGLPCVGTSIAGVPEQIVDGETGFVVPPADPGALAAALERLVSSPRIRAELGEAGRARVLKTFSTTAYVEGVTALYRRLHTGGRARPD